jgi:hypothetical protein
LPEIQEEIEHGIASTRAAINKLSPVPSTDPLNDIASLLHAFTSDLHEHAMGIPETRGLMQTIAPAQQDFRRAVRQTAPMFVPFSRKQVKAQSLPPVKFLDNEEEVETMLLTEAHSLEPPRPGLSRGVPDGSENRDALEEGPIYIDDVFALANESVFPLHVASPERY